MRRASHGRRPGGSRGFGAVTSPGTAIGWGSSRGFQEPSGLWALPWVPSRGGSATSGFAVPPWGPSRGCPNCHFSGTARVGVPSRGRGSHQVSRFHHLQGATLRGSEPSRLRHRPGGPRGGSQSRQVPPHSPGALAEGARRTQCPALGVLSRVGSSAPWRRAPSTPHPPKHPHGRLPEPPAPAADRTSSLCEDCDYPGCVCRMVSVRGQLGLGSLTLDPGWRVLAFARWGGPSVSGRDLEAYCA